MNFLADLINRMFSKTPHFFRVVRAIMLITMLITGIPEILTQLDIVLPEKIAFIASKTVAIAAMTAAFVSQLAKVEPVTHPSDIYTKLKEEEKKAAVGLV